MHRNAKLTPAGRRILVERIASGRPAAHVAAEMGVARKTAYKWWQRWLAEGEAGLQDRSSRPQRSPTRVPTRLERRIERLRHRRKLGPARIAWRLRMAPSTVYRVLCRLGLNRLSWLDRPTGRVIRRRYEHPRPGDLLHMDVKKLGRIPPGGGWRVHGRGRDRHHGHSRVGFAYIHSSGQVRSSPSASTNRAVVEGGIEMQLLDQELHLLVGAGATDHPAAAQCCDLPGHAAHCAGRAGDEDRLSRPAARRPPPSPCRR